MPSGHMHFRIDGEDFTRMARERLLSELPDNAWKLFTEGLGGGEPGALDHIAKQVLDGKMKLVGNETIGLSPVEDTDEATKKYISDSKYIYAGRVRHEGRWWRPKTRVTNFGPDDMPRGRIPTFTGLSSRSSKAALARDRTSFYCCEEDRVLLSGVIFEPCGEPPHWWKRNLSPAAALEDFLAAGRTLEEDGWHQRFGDRIEEEKPKKPAKPSQEKMAAQREAFRIERAKEEELARKEDMLRGAWLARVGSLVREQAKKDMFEMPLEDGTSISIPRAPFWNWALRRTTLRHLAPSWECIAKGGEKMPCDDPYHTDWVLGAGLTLDKAYEGPVKDASWKARFELQERLGNFECGVVNSGADVTGTVGKEILVLRDLHPDHLEAMLKAQGIITEAGGRGAHLVQVAMERNIPIMRVEDAFTRFPVGLKLILMPSEGKIRVPGYMWDEISV